MYQIWNRNLSRRMGLCKFLNKIVSRVRGSVTNNNWFWIWLFDLLTSLQVLLITINYSAIANPATSHITKICSILVLVLSTVTSLGIRFSYNHFARTQRKTQPVLLAKLVFRVVAYQLTTHCCHALKREGVYRAVTYQWAPYCCMNVYCGNTLLSRCLATGIHTTI
jgi:hypothetical protein